MAINPIVYTEKIIRSFLKYQLSTYPFSDPGLHRQMRDLLNLDHIRHTPLLQGPYISLSRSFKQGPAVSEWVGEGLFHPHMPQIIGSDISHLYGHQANAVRAIHERKTTLISTGTGSGKTECFLYPIISRCLELRDAQVPAGISAVIVYPMNALAEDQLDRMRRLLAGSGITFGLYVGKTPEYEREVTGLRQKPGSSRADYEAVLQEFRRQGRPDTVHPPEEVCSREMMRTPGRQPRILLTNIKQMELLLTRHTDVELFDNARLDFLVFDEAHTFTGIQGAETACLIRRLRRFCGRELQDTVSIATSATIVDRRDPEAGKRFAARFFGVEADNVECVYEEYEAEPWAAERKSPSAPIASPHDLLARALRAVDSESPDAEIRSVYEQLTGQTLKEGLWTEALHKALIANELAHHIHIALRRPITLNILMSQLNHVAGRPVSEEEVLTYLALGAAAFLEGRPVYRPMVHVYVRGIPGAVVSFPEGHEPQLWLSAADEIAAHGGKDVLWRPPIHTCVTCGQHYFTTWLKDYKFTAKSPEGGQVSEDGGTYWEPLDKKNGGRRCILVDQVISQDEETDLEEENWSFPLLFCRYCGAAHEAEFARCQNCGQETRPVKLFAVHSNAKSPGYLSSCVSCGARGKSLGRGYREPIREVRAVNVSDVHVLAQDMVHHAERQRLLLFTDNRQDAAFQAGWMKDHARRFRLRRLMAEIMQDSPVSVASMVLKLDDMLDNDDALSQALIPEVWRVIGKDGSGGAHEEERKYFLHIQVLREITTADKQRHGLEPWGRLKVMYQGLDSGSRFIQEWSRKIGLPPDDLKGGIEALLDQLRRQRLLYDPVKEIFSRYWNEGDREIQRGYLPTFPAPKGMKFRNESNDKKEYVRAWLTDRATLIRQIAQKWGLSAQDAPVFLEGLWDFLRRPGLDILVPVTLRGGKGTPLPGSSGAFQINAHRLMLCENHGYYRCQKCRRKVSRRPPHNLCLAWHCDGRLEFVAEEPDNYDLQLLDEGYSMLRPEEHTAMVPQEQRDRFENWFKGQSDRVNTLVCTPTLELGIDIGALDSVLLRNVPPLPANYWQRVGRAGRRHRMAVVFCYSRPASHDRAYFNDPTKMLEGRIDPPSFNLRNEVLIAKHIHAAVITRLFQLTRPQSGLDETARHGIQETLRMALPSRITHYLFEPDGPIRTQPYDLIPLRELLDRCKGDLLPYVIEIFQRGWPAEDRDSITEHSLSRVISRMADELNEVLLRLRKRLLWAHNEIKRLSEVRIRLGTLEQDEETLFRRCDRLIKKMKGVMPKKRRESEGVDDINTYGVLAREGFLPGYGLDTGTVIGMADVPAWLFNSMEFELPRPTALALREYVPGNLIYANGHRFVARRFHREATQEQNEMPMFDVNLERGAIAETNIGQNAGALDSATLRALSVCDVDLIHQSQISDEEENRFQMPVMVFGKELNRHNGGRHFTWGERSLLMRRGVHLRLANVGSTPAIEQRQILGYPICYVCGQSVSPLSSDAQIEHFLESHRERCGRLPEHLGFFADVVADCLTLPNCPNRVTAYSVLESIRMAATLELDMHLEDLQVLAIGHIDRDEVDGYLWDPMPGGSGLLEQIRDHFTSITTKAMEIALNCPSSCESSCIDCLQTFRNSFYHRHLDRHAAIEGLREWGDTLKFSHDVLPVHPTSPIPDLGHMPVNDAETKLKHMLEAAGFISGVYQKQIRFKPTLMLDHIIGSTTPDVFFHADEDDPDDKGLAIYLDGMSVPLHGNSETAAKDREIRYWLSSHGYQVVEITYVELDDREAMIRHFRKIARYLSGKDLAKQIQDNASWFETANAAGVGNA